VKRRLFNMMIEALLIFCMLAVILWARELELQGDHGHAKIFMLIPMAVLVIMMFYVTSQMLEETIRLRRYKMRCFWFGHNLRSSSDRCPECGKILRKRK
jgi:uncharacterized membrane protein YcjF (UPF0283 family)